MLIGEYTHAIDEKNRVSLPAKFRVEMGKKLVICPGLDNCLWVFTVKEWKRFSENLAESQMFLSDNRRFNRFILGGAVEADVDSNGRILVPDFLRSRAKLKSKVALIGVETRVEIWDEDAWKIYKTEVEKEADALAEKLGQVGMI
jgi:MraZ protein